MIIFDDDGIGHDVVSRKVVDAAMTDIQTNIDSMKKHAKNHEKEVRQNGEAVAAGMKMARDIFKKHLGEEVEHE